MKFDILFYSNDLAIRHAFPDITHIKVNNNCKSAILNLIKLKFIRAYLFLKLHILFYSNGLAIWHSFQDITHIEINNSHKTAILNLIELKN